MHAENASGPPPECARPVACECAAECELAVEPEQAGVIPATTATATASRASRRALRARRSSGLVRVDPGLRMGTSSLSAVRHSRCTERPVTRREHNLLPCCNRPTRSLGPWRDPVLVLVQARWDQA